MSSQAAMSWANVVATAVDSDYEDIPMPPGGISPVSISKVNFDAHPAGYEGAPDMKSPRGMIPGALRVLNDDKPTPGDENNLFIGDLARDLTEADLEEVFRHYGDVIAVSIKRNRITGKNLGYGFVRMGSHEEAIAAKDGLHMRDVRGRKIRVGWSMKNSSLFIRDLDPSVTTEILREAFRPFGTLVEDQTMVMASGGPADQWKPLGLRPRRRWASVRFEHREEAELARREMNGRVLGQTAIKIEWSFAPRGKDQNGRLSPQGMMEGVMPQLPPDHPHGPLFGVHAPPGAPPHAMGPYTSMLSPTGAGLMGPGRFEPQQPRFLSTVNVSVLVSPSSEPGTELSVDEASLATTILGLNAEDMDEKLRCFFEPFGQLVGIFKAAKIRNKKSPAAQSKDGVEPEIESTELVEAGTEPELAPEVEEAQPSPETEAEDPSTPEGSDQGSSAEPEGSPVSAAHGPEEETAGKGMPAPMIDLKTLRRSASGAFTFANVAFEHSPQGQDEASTAVGELQNKTIEVAGLTVTMELVVIYPKVKAKRRNMNKRAWAGKGMAPMGFMGMNGMGALNDMGMPIPGPPMMGPMASPPMHGRGMHGPGVAAPHGMGPGMYNMSVDGRMMGPGPQMGPQMGVSMDFGWNGQPMDYGFNHPNHMMMMQQQPGPYGAPPSGAYYPPQGMSGYGQVNGNPGMQAPPGAFMQQLPPEMYWQQQPPQPLQAYGEGMKGENGVVEGEGAFKMPHNKGDNTPIVVDSHNNMYFGDGPVSVKAL